MSTTGIAPWLLGGLTALASLVACGAVARTNVVLRVRPSRPNPFHVFSSKAVLGLVPIVVATLAAWATSHEASAVQHSLVVTTSLAVLGAIDDVRPLSPGRKLLWQAPVAAFVVPKLKPHRLSSTLARV